MTIKHIEIEVKIKVPSLQEIKPKIISSGFRISVPYTFEQNILFDSLEEQLKKSKCLLRLRRAGSSKIITFKRPLPQVIPPSSYKIKEEIEVEVSDFENTRTIFNALGFTEFFIYEKYREVYDNGSVKVMMDHTPLGDFLEIEGEADEIDKVATQLGFRKADYITDNYLTLFRKEHKTGFMQFEDFQPTSVDRST